MIGRGAAAMRNNELQLRELLQQIALDQLHHRRRVSIDVMGVDELKPVENGYLQRWPVSKRVNSSKADTNDPTLIDPVKQAA